MVTAGSLRAGIGGRKMKKKKPRDGVKMEMAERPGGKAPPMPPMKSKTKGGAKKRLKGMAI